MQQDVLKDRYTLEVHSGVTTMYGMYGNIGKLDFYKWHQEKKNYSKYTLRG